MVSPEFHWSCDDVEAARIMANELARPSRLGGLSPDEAWQSRTTISENDRFSFKNLLQNFRVEALIDYCDGMAPDISDEKLGQDLAQCERDAMRRTLESSGLLIERREWIPLPNKRRFLP